MESTPTPVQKMSVPAPVSAREFGILARKGFKQTRTLQRIALGLTILVYVLLRLRHLGQYSLWYDEVFSVVVARSSWSEMFHQILIDRVHPPVFYICLKLWIAAIGNTVVRVRLFSVLLSTATLIPIWTCLTRVKSSSRLSCALLFAIATNPFLIFYAQEVRMYALLGFVAACSLSFYLAQEENKTELWLLSLTNVLLVMTHAAGAAVVGGELAHTLIARNRSRRYVAFACGPALASFACWMLSVRFLAPHPAMVLHNVSWIPKPTFVLAWKTLAHILGGGAALVVLNVPIAIVCFKRLRDRQFLLLLLLSIGTIVCVFGLSVFIRPVWQERYLII